MIFKKNKKIALGLTLLAGAISTYMTCTKANNIDSTNIINPPKTTAKFNNKGDFIYKISKSQFNIGEHDQFNIKTYIDIKNKLVDAKLDTNFYKNNPDSLNHLVLSNNNFKVLRYNQISNNDSTNFKIYNPLDQMIQEIIIANNYNSGDWNSKYKKVQSIEYDNENNITKNEFLIDNQNDNIFDERYTQNITYDRGITKKIIYEEDKNNDGINELVESRLFDKNGRQIEFNQSKDRNNDRIVDLEKIIKYNPKGKNINLDEKNIVEQTVKTDDNFNSNFENVHIQKFNPNSSKKYDKKTLDYNDDEKNDFSREEIYDTKGQLLELNIKKTLKKNENDNKVDVNIKFASNGAGLSYPDGDFFNIEVQSFRDIASHKGLVNEFTDSLNFSEANIIKILNDTTQVKYSIKSTWNNARDTREINLKFHNSTNNTQDENKLIIESFKKSYTQKTYSNNKKILDNITVIDDLSYFSQVSFNGEGCYVSGITAPNYNITNKIDRNKDGIFDLISTEAFDFSDCIGNDYSIIKTIKSDDNFDNYFETNRVITNGNSSNSITTKDRNKDKIIDYKMKYNSGCGYYSNSTCEEYFDDNYDQKWDYEKNNKWVVSTVKNSNHGFTAVYNNIKNITFYSNKNNFLKTTLNINHNDTQLPTYTLLVNSNNDENYDTKFNIDFKTNLMYQFNNLDDQFTEIERFRNFKFKDTLSFNNIEKFLDKTELNVIKKDEDFKDLF